MVKAQISIEYLILTGFVLLIIVIPSIYFISTITNQGLRAGAEQAKINALGNGLVDGAQQLYFLGLYSKKTVELEIPENVDQFFIVDIDQGGDEHAYYIGVFTDDGSEQIQNFYLSEVPITANPVEYGVTDSLPDPVFSGCEAPTTNICTFTHFTDNFVKPGTRAFELETILQADDVSVVITPVQQ